MVKKGSLSEFILLTIEKTIDGYVRLEDFLYNPHFYLYGGRVVKKSRLSKAIERLRKRGLIDLVEEQQLLFKLTDNGFKDVTYSKIRQKSADSTTNIKTYVSFDIPETRRKFRNEFRRNLKDWGFVNEQKSLWRSDVDCFDEIREFITVLGVSDWVKVIKALC